MNNPLLGVVNPEHPDFQTLQRNFPKAALAARRVNPEKGQIPMRFEDRPQEYFKRGGAWGGTMPGLGPNNPTLLALNPNRPPTADTSIHELLHALYSKTPSTEPSVVRANPPEWSGLDIVRGVMNRIDPQYGAKLLNMYLDRGETLGHAATEAMSTKMTQEAGLPWHRRKFTE